jgi:hypothetical protein
MIVDVRRTSVSGRMTMMTFRTDGNHRYSWIKNTPNFRRSFNGEANNVSKNHNSAIIVR